MHRIFYLIALLSSYSIAYGAENYSPPTASANAVFGVNFNGESVGKMFRSRFMECDSKNTCDGKPLKYKCSTDLNHNSTLLKLKGETIFYDAKMGLDADGSPYSKKTPGQTDQPNTSLRYPSAGKLSINADRVPFIVIPLGGFDKALGIEVGDIAAVVYGGKRVFAVIADQGPMCKVGEGSMQLHESLGHIVCTQRDAIGDCVKLKNVGIEKGVMYFLFPGTKKAIYPGLTADNINSRINTVGARAWETLSTP